MAWSENKWRTVISALGTVLGVVVPLLLYVANRDSKELTVKTVSRAVVADLTDPKLASFKLTYNDLVVSRLTAATIEVRNSGNRPIGRGDFERDLVIRFVDPVLAATVADSVPEQLRPDLSVSSTNVVIKPLLLNPGDLFRLTVHLRGDFAEPVVDGRISGVTAIQRFSVLDDLSKRRTVRMAITVLIGFLELACYFFLGGLIRPFQVDDMPVISKVTVILLMIVMAVSSGLLLQLSNLTFDLSTGQIITSIIVIMVVSIPFFLVGIRQARLWRLQNKAIAQVQSRRPDGL